MAQTIFDILWKQSIIGLAEVNIEGKFIKANPIFCEILGYNESELQHKSWKDITHPDDVASFAQMFDKAILSEVTSYAGEKRYITKRGNIIWCNVHTLVIKKDEQIVEIFLKQVIAIPAVTNVISQQVTATESKKRFDWRDQYKIILAAIIGLIMVIYGSVSHNTEIQNLGIALTVGVFGGFISQKK